jgi:IQ calmodulin-binding motif
MHAINLCGALSLQKTVQGADSSTDSADAAAAIKIQTIFRGYIARRRLEVGLIHLRK